MNTAWDMLTLLAVYLKFELPCVSCVYSLNPAARRVNLPAAASPAWPLSVRVAAEPGPAVRELIL